MSSSSTSSTDASESQPLSSQHTASFAGLLEHFGISIAVTTYQAGKLVLLRSHEGTVNTHFRSFNKPMGLALAADRLAIGTALEIWEFHNAPGVARRQPTTTTEGQEANLPVSCSSMFLPRGSATTGNIQIHEMLWVDRQQADRTQSSSAPSDAELWFINTRFSCLCTRNLNYSFVPQWRPPFVSEIAPEDRCHLNGFCLAPSKIRGVPKTNAPTFLVTALGETDTPQGWRANKSGGGILMETASNEVLLRGLSMPHSPRIYADDVWVLESGNGSIGRVDVQAGRYEEVATLPGFTRGIDFIDRYAFIGLSQVRESAIFSGIKIAERPVSERVCGIWVIDIVTGQTVAWLKFDEGVQEIFAITVMPNSRWPDVINDDSSLIADSFVLPDDSLAAVPNELLSMAPQ